MKQRPEILNTADAAKILERKQQEELSGIAQSFESQLQNLETEFNNKKSDLKLKYLPQVTAEVLQARSKEEVLGNIKAQENVSN